MSEKRKDNRGRLLHNGEMQMPDGRYRFKYVDLSGEEKVEYSWKLDKNDKVPSGKRDGLSLREKEKVIQRDMFYQISADGGKITVLELVEKYIGTKTGVRPTTEANYKTVINLLKKDPFGSRRIDSVKRSDAKTWLIKLQKDDGKGYSSIHNIRGVIRPAFRLAYDDDLITKNPFDFQLVDVVVNDSVTREALSREEERKFLKFVEDDPHFSRYYDGIYILFNTGLRISEFCGLTISDINFKKHTIRVDHQLQKRGSTGYYIEETKTESGKRVIPMEKDVEDCFKRIIKNRKPPKKEPMIDGKTGFLFFDKNGSVMYSLHWEKYFQHIREKYNSIYKVQMPCVTPHVCRHTYCSKKAKSGMNPVILQYLMGHSDISVTYNVYTHTRLEDAIDELERLKSEEGTSGDGKKNHRKGA